jgi:hypothetical protein
MVRFIAGMALGLALGSSVAALAAGVFGSGSLDGWKVTQGGQEVCVDPDVVQPTRTIECD